MRILATLIDYGVCVYVPQYLISQVLGSNISFVLMILALGFNPIYTQGKTGQSLGNRLLHQQVTAIWADQQQNTWFVRAGYFAAVVRLVMTAAFWWLGIFTAMFSFYRQTPSDWITGTVVLQRRSKTNYVRLYEKGVDWRRVAP